jgi:hypothetical protein
VADERHDWRRRERERDRCQHRSDRRRRTTASQRGRTDAERSHACPLRVTGRGAFRVRSASYTNLGAAAAWPVGELSPQPPVCFRYAHLVDVGEPLSQVDDLDLVAVLVAPLSRLGLRPLNLVARVRQEARYDAADRRRDLEQVRDGRRVDELIL